MIEITQEARQRILGQASNKGCEPYIVIDIKSTGCSGFEYKINWLEEGKPEILIYARNPIRIYATPQAAAILDGATLVVRKEGLNVRFDLDNLSEKNRCGCGKSFNI